MCKVYLCRERKKWRVRLVDTELKRKQNYFYDTKEEAEADMPRLRREYRRPVGRKISEALEEYRRHLETRGNRRGHPNRPRTVEVTISRLEKVFAKDIYTGDLSSTVVQQLWDAYKVDKAVDTLYGALATCRTFFRWLNAKRWLKHLDALDGIEVLGRRRKGKAQLTERRVSAASRCRNSSWS